MTKKLFALLAALAAAAFLGLGAPGARAECVTDSSYVSAEEDPDGDGNAVTGPHGDSGTTVYAGGHAEGDPTQGGYIGVTGSNGYIEVEGTGVGGDAKVHGDATNAPVNGNVGTGGVCVADQTAP